MSQQSEYERRQPVFARDRAIILQILHKEKRKAIRDFGRFKGLTYDQIRHWYNIREGRFKDLGNRIRELRKQGLVITVKEMDGRKHVYPVK